MGKLDSSFVFDIQIGCICYPICLYHLKQFVFLSIFSENG
ncbi:hypothetical protein M111_1404 [Bacteroides fragilis str. 3986T(B)10]|nr:hypothetical protein M111_1404 [Bacteroides fragilis str. 3986T(B)10]